MRDVKLVDVRGEMSHQSATRFDKEFFSATNNMQLLARGHNAQYYLSELAHFSVHSIVS